MISDHELRRRLQRLDTMTEEAAAATILYAYMRWPFPPEPIDRWVLSWARMV